MSKIIDHFEERLKAGDLSTEELRAITGRMDSLKEKVGGYTRLDSMVTNSFLTEEEATSLQEPLTELPQEKKLLIACYVLYSKAIVMQDVSVKDATEVATTFVMEKRRRIRVELKKALLVRIANALSLEPVEDEETGEPIDSIPYLRDMAKENGYRENAKSLNEDDRKALSLCADYYLDLLEVLSLNGVGDARTERNEGLYDEEGYLKGTFYYEDIEDEALMEFSDVYYFMGTLYALALNSPQAFACNVSKKSVEWARIINSVNFTPEDLVLGHLLNTKFREYVIDLYTDEELKKKLSPETLAKREKFLEEQGLTGSTDEAPATPVKKATPKKSTTKAKNTKSK